MYHTSTYANQAIVGHINIQAARQRPVRMTDSPLIGGQMREQTRDRQSNFAVNRIIPSCESASRTTVWPSYCNLTFSMPSYRERSDSPSSGGLKQKNDEDDETACEKQRPESTQVLLLMPAITDLTSVVYFLLKHSHTRIFEHVTKCMLG